MDLSPRTFAQAATVSWQAKHQEPLVAHNPQIISHLEPQQEIPAYFSLHALQLIDEADVIKPTMQ